MTGRLCAAALPRAGTDDRKITWIECGEPATGVYVYACVHEHVTERATCDAHAPEPGAVGCRRCFEAGHECPMDFEGFADP